ncbi:MAG: aminotransferase class V-fold PLP-dependent enzyme [Acidobacteriota bacterium]|nr:MAG: aminotransferase class V-fold PLP-dependent enzyme [Acidobacteriota bacterium]
MDLSELSGVLQEVTKALKPYEEGIPKFRRLPESGMDWTAIVDLMRKLGDAEAGRWKDGHASGAVYHGDDEYNRFLSEVYALNVSSNPLHPDIWPSAMKFESEIVAMTAGMLGADRTSDRIVGTLSSGGTDSILLAMKTYRDRARTVKGIAEPEIVAPVTAHAAFDKAAHYFDMKIVKVPVGEDFRADVAAIERAINANTAVIVGSAPPFPHGLVDPIEELSELARNRGIGFHTDACLGGFILPWAEKLGYDVPPFDFRLPGVTSISADTHKFGYAPKGSSVVLYRGEELRHHQYFSITDWPGGLYFTPSFAGSRSGALIAACWAAMVSMGEKGYLEAARRILETAEWIKRQIRQIPELEVIGDPLFVIALRSESFSIYQVQEFMSRRGWSLNGLILPSSVHICVTLRHAQPGVRERLIDDLRAAVEYVKANPDAPAGLGPLYGMGSSIELRGVAKGVLDTLLDMMYE